MIFSLISITNSLRSFLYEKLYLCSMIVNKASFVCSNTELSGMPDPRLPEYAFIGRSNVGKSSLINALVSRKELAKTSQQPGKTQLINHFIINDNWYLVDLPGYGYAKTSKENRKTWSKFINNYLLNRENLQCVMVLIDSRHEPQKLDLEFCCWLGENGIPFYLIFTKADKSKGTVSSQNMAKFKRALKKWFEEVPASVLTSSKTRQGCDTVLQWVDSINGDFLKH